MRFIIKNNTSSEINKIILHNEHSNNNVNDCPAIYKTNTIRYLELHIDNCLK
jgi:hypothetical protein